MKKLFLFLILLLMPSLVLAVPVSYYGNIIYDGDITTGHSLRAESDTGTTEKTIYQEQFLLNHLANKDELVKFYFDNSNILNYTQPLPGSIINLGDVEIGNEPPTIEVNVIPNVAYTVDNLICNVTKSYDPEGDAITYTYKWYKNGALQSSSTSTSTTSTLPSSNTAKGELWNCTVTPSDGKTHSDGTIYGKPASDKVKILNSPPRIDSVEPVGAEQSLDEEDSLAFSVIALDDDEDALTYSWKLDGSEEETSDSFTYVSSLTDAGTHALILTVSDGELSKTQSWKITVNNVNQAPVLDAIGAQTLTEDALFTYDVNATDADTDDTPTFYDDTTLFSIDSSTGLISFTPTQADIGIGVDSKQYDVKILVEDGKGKYDNETVTFTINNEPDAPVLDSVGTQTLIQNKIYTKQLTATDEDGDTLTFTDDTDLFDISANGLINFTPTNDDVRTYTVRITVSDGTLTDYEDILFLVANKNDPPIINSITPNQASVNIAEPNDQIFTITKSDPDGGTPSVKWYLNNIVIEGETSDIYTFNGDYTSAGTYTIKAEISDGEFTRSNTWTLTVNDNNRAPTLTVESDPCTEDVACTIDVTASEDDTDNTLVYSENTTMFAIGLLTGAVSFTPTQANVGVHSILFRVADGTDADTETTTLTITNVNDAPVLERIGSRTLLEDDSYSISVTATDEDLGLGDTLTYSLTNEPSGMTIDSATGIIIWTPTFQDSGNYDVRVSVNDSSGAEDYEDVSFTVLNQNQDPIINETDSTPAQYVIMKEDSSTTFTVSASDPDGTELTTSWYKDDVLLEDEISESYTFEGDFSDEGTNAGVYAVKVEVSDGIATESYTWTLNVTRTRDSDKDNIPDYRDNCRLVYNPSQVDSDANGIGDTCENNIDGDDVEDDNDFVLGDKDNVETNVENMDLEIGGSSNLNQVINETKSVNLTETTYNETTGEAVTVPVVEFEYEFTSNSSLDLGNLSVKKQTGNESGSVIIAGIDLTAQGKTKTVYVDRLAGEDYVCVKDAEIASITELPSGDCTGTGETAVPCSIGGSTSGVYTCTIIDNKFKVEGLSHSGVTESTYTPPSPPPTGDGGPAATGGGGGGGGGCFHNWGCTEWSDCIEEKQTRECTYKGTCFTPGNKPDTERSCEVPVEEEVEEAEAPLKEMPEKAEEVTPPRRGLGEITVAAVAAVTEAVSGKESIVSIIVIILVVVSGFFVFTNFYGGIPGADHFTRASNFHRRAEKSHRNGKHEKSEKLYKKAQTLREEGEKIIFKGSELESKK